ncbi:ABC transporter permease [Luteolibacter flavescens]|uniref:ABC transporter permease n=1 Tax=Luteolibacter flavescens TaxID=1859460 RepID=A0ABT3FW86_9BACT|nr:ABC transporter permease [Luteolibacter flavescens]MCW1887496.1 ABC transporter permease [Luteolibacter flavescens]
MHRPAPNRPLNPRRIGVIAMHTFTQLVRMKVFYFLGIFAVILLASNLFNIQHIDRPNLEGMEVLRSIRNLSLGTMTMFSVVIGIVATALLIPKDVEDRTLYTILAKPVPRLDYLVGKLGGLVLLIFTSLLLMDLLMMGVLTIRTNMVLEAQTASALRIGWPPDQIAAMKEETAKLGPGWDLQVAVLAVFLRAVVIASAALLLSILSSSTLFTTVTGFIVYFIGNFQATAREVYFDSAGVSAMERLAGLAVATIFPDMSLYNVIDKIISGMEVPPGTVATLCGVTGFYLVMHLFVSWLVFSKKEF